MLLNFIEIGKIVAEMWQFKGSQNGGHLLFSEVKFLMADGFKRASVHHDAKLCGDDQTVVVIWRFIIETPKCTNGCKNMSF